MEREKNCYSLHTWLNDDALIVVHQLLRWITPIWPAAWNWMEIWITRNWPIDHPFGSNGSPHIAPRCFPSQSVNRAHALNHPCQQCARGWVVVARGIRFSSFSSFSPRKRPRPDNNNRWATMKIRKIFSLLENFSSIRRSVYNAVSCYAEANLPLIIVCACRVSERKLWKFLHFFKSEMGLLAQRYNYIEKSEFETIRLNEDFLLPWIYTKTFSSRFNSLLFVQYIQSDWHWPIVSCINEMFDKLRRVIIINSTRFI